MNNREPFVYKPNTGEQAVNTDWCRYAVHHDFGVGFRQCTRTPSISVSGYMFCKQHAVMALKDVERKV